MAEVFIKYNTTVAQEKEKNPVFLLRNKADNKKYGFTHEIS